VTFSKIFFSYEKIITDAKSIAALQYGITAIAVYILLDPDQKIIMKSVGDIEFIREKIKDIF